MAEASSDKKGALEEASKHTAEVERLNGLIAALKQKVSQVQAQMREGEKAAAKEVADAKAAAAELSKGHEDELRKIQEDQGNEAKFVQNEIKQRTEEARALGEKVKELKVVEEGTKSALRAVESALSEKESALSESKSEIEKLRSALESTELSVAKALSEGEAKASQISKTGAELVSLREAAKSFEESSNVLKTENVRLTGLVQRLQSDAESAEVKYGQRTALVGVLESELNEVKAKLKEKEEKVRRMTCSCGVWSQNNSNPCQSIAVPLLRGGH